MNKADKNIIEEIMDKINVSAYVSENQSIYGYRNVVYKITPTVNIIVDKYSEYPFTKKNLSDSEIKKAIKLDFKNRLKKAYEQEGIEGINRVLEPFNLLD